MSPEMWIAVAVFVGLNFVAASSGGMFKPGPWYAGLNKPSWTPPNWAFPVVWGLLFALNAWAGWLIWEAIGMSRPDVLALYVGSLILNAGWSWLFFGIKRMDWALIDVALLWLSLVAVIAVFWSIRPAAALPVLPYLLWVTIAAALNRAMIRLNPGKARG
ncbi:sensory protein TspO [Brevundimonas sp. AAP58]|uniref:TspO/MBR family protein n=1 Tax=Brevundimonas sp. AAP58 TaxID=1523422 RepID=UPI0006B943D0|nr:TspO/MBR family protein [Brevundimonas sp. AAP58]KPF83425.1 sensory protein TspO [Brevundimonas sp. AAP58]